MFGIRPKPTKKVTTHTRWDECLSGVDPDEFATDDDLFVSGRPTDDPSGRQECPFAPVTIDVTSPGDSHSGPGRVSDGEEKGTRRTTVL